MASPLPVPWPARLILVLLPPLLAATLYWQSQHFDHGVVELRAAGAGVTTTTAYLPMAVGGRERVGTVRSFSRDNLYEYVNGHAEYYISAGFQGLAVGEYGADAQGQPALVVNLWDMGAPLHAFGVLMDEAGPEAVPLEGELPGFQTGNGLSLVHGRYYLQLSTFASDVDLLAAAAELRLAVGPAQDAGPVAADFPALGRATGTRFVKENYRGLDMLANVIERRFERDGAQREAFLIQGSSEQVADVERRLLSFLDAEGIEHQPVAVGSRSVHRVNDRYEGDWFFFAVAGRLVGVFAPLDAVILDAVRAYLERSAAP